MRRGYITVFLSLSLTLILSLVFTVIEGARISAIRMKFECVADIGMNSVLAEYHRELLKQYDLLFVDTSYGGSHPNIANTEAHLRRYAQKNCRPGEGKGLFGGRDFLAMDMGMVEIPAYSVASDENGAVLKRQVTDYMGDYPMGALVDKLSANVGLLQGAGIDTKDVDAWRRQYEEQIEEIGLPEKETEDGGTEEVPLNNPADAVNALRSSGVLNLVLENPAAVSAVKVDLSDYISHRSGRMTGTGLCAEAVEAGGAPNDLVFQMYLFEKCGYYGAEMDKSLLKYQVEYIVAGRDGLAESGTGGKKTAALAGGIQHAVSSFGQSKNGGGGDFGFGAFGRTAYAGAGGAGQVYDSFCVGLRGELTGCQDAVWRRQSSHF